MSKTPKHLEGPPNLTLVADWNDILKEFEDSLVTISEPTSIALVAVYAPIFLISLIGNISVIVVVCRHHYMRKAKNYFLMNLSIADLLVTLTCVPITLGSTLYRKWVYGEAMCKLLGFFQGVSVASSIYSLTALSLDRYLAVKHPALFRRVSNPSNGVKLLGLIWLTSMIFMMPLLYIRRVFSDDIVEFHIIISFCIETWSTNGIQNAFAIFMLVMVYTIPCSVVIYCHYVVCRTLRTEMIREDSDCNGTGHKVSRRSIARMLIALVTCFVLCWLPYNITSLWFDLQANVHASNVLPFTLLLAHANSAVNPIIFWLLNNHFRSGMNRIISCRWSTRYMAKKRNANPQIVIHQAPACQPMCKGGDESSCCDYRNRSYDTNCAVCRHAKNKQNSGARV